jgi:hypothetical protein
VLLLVAPNPKFAGLLMVELKPPKPPPPKDMVTVCLASRARYCLLD